MQVNLLETRTGSFSLKFRCYGARIKFRTGALPRIFNYSTKHFDLSDNLKHPTVSSLRIKRTYYSTRKQANAIKKQPSIQVK